MADTLALYWLGEEEPLVWAAGGCRGMAQTGDDLPEAGTIRLILDGACVATRRILLPARAPRQIQAALGFALEDELAHEPEGLHMAYSVLDADQHRWVAAVDAAVMADIKDRLGARWADVVWAGADYWLLEAPEKKTAVMHMDMRLLARGAGLNGFAMEADLGRAVLPAWLEDQDGETEAVHQTEMDMDAWLHHMAERDGMPALSLLQGVYARKSPLRVDWRKGAMAAGLVLALLVTQILSLWSEAARLDRSADAMTVQAEDMLRTAFPDIRRVVNPRAQMRSRLNALGGADVQAGFLPLLAMVNDTLADMDGAALQSLRYDGRNTRLSFSVRLNSFADIERLQQGLRTAGGQVQEGSARAGDAGVMAEFDLWQS